MDEVKTMRYETQIQLVPSSMMRLNKEFALVDILLCYHGDNRNRTSISKEVIEAALPSLYGIPIVGEYIYLDDGSQDFGSHGGKIIISDKGIKFEDTTKPYGFITKEAVENAKWVTITEKDGFTKHEYLKLSSCIIWEKRYEEVSALLEKNYGQSMEIVMNKGHYNDDDYYVVEDMTFSAACILGSDPSGNAVEPCFESACIGRHHELDSFKKEFSLMLDEYKKFNLELIENTKKEEKKIMNLDNLKSFLSTFKVGSGDDKADRYTLVGEQTENTFTVIDAMENFKVYTVEYALDDENNVAAVWDKKVERKFAVVDYETENALAIGDVIDFKSMAEKVVEDKITAATNELNASYGAQLAEKDTAYAELETKYNSAASKLAEYQKAEIEAARDAHRKEINNIVDSFADRLKHNAEFLVYKAKLNPDEKTVDQVNNDIVYILGQEMLNATKRNNKNFSYHPQETKAMKPIKEDPYGGLLDKWTK